MTLELEHLSRGKVALLIEVVVDPGIGGGELLQATHPLEPLHRKRRLCPMPIRSLIAA
jgi:hypothetical protein